MAQLRTHRHELSRLRTRVVIIAFAEQARGREWLRDNAVPFPLLLDPERRVYRAYDLERSVLRTWSPRTVWYYIRRLAAGARLERTRGDPYQLGGDFVVDPSGVVRLAYYSRDPADRPPVARLLEELGALSPSALEPPRG